MKRGIGGLSRFLTFARESGYLEGDQEGDAEEDSSEKKEGKAHPPPPESEGLNGVEEFVGAQMDGYEVLRPPPGWAESRGSGGFVAEVAKAAKAACSSSSESSEEEEGEGHGGGHSGGRGISTSGEEERERNGRGLGGGVSDDDDDDDDDDEFGFGWDAIESSQENETCVNCAQPTYACEGEICHEHHCWEETDLARQIDEFAASGKTEEEVWHFEGALLTSRLTLTPRVFKEPPRGTLLACDRRMTLHKPAAGDAHPERPRRLSAMYHHLVAAGVAKRCIQVQGTECTEEEILLCHTPSHRDIVESCSQGLVTHVGSDTYACIDSSMAARLATGTVLNAVRRVARGEVANGAVIVRPPGHHAEKDQVMGFCFYNYVAVAAMMAIQEFGLERVLILDWDVHHGNGTQNMFWDDKRALYISLHRYDNGSFYPGTGGVHEVGVGDGEGYNVNIPWPHGAMGDAEYLAAFHSIVMPIAHQYAPQLVLVSAGFDAADGDPLGGCHVTPGCYAQMTSLLRNLAGGRMVVALEGGYNLRSISNSMEGVVRVLLGEAPPELPDWRDKVPKRGAMVALRQVAQVFGKYWSSLQLATAPTAPISQTFERQQQGQAAGRSAGGRGWGRKPSGRSRLFPSLREWMLRYGKHWGRSGVWSWHVAKKRRQRREQPDHAHGWEEGVSWGAGGA